MAEQPELPESESPKLMMPPGFVGVSPLVAPSKEIWELRRKALEKEKSGK